MALMSAYLVTTKNLEAFLNALKSAKAPERMTFSFLKQLDFTSSNDRLLIPLLKGLRLLDESAAPTERYYQFLDQTQSGRVLADGIREAYEDLFAINRNAQELTADDVKNKLRTLTQGQKSENVLNLSANTFRALCDLADWTAPPAQTVVEEHPPSIETSAAKQDLQETPEESGLRRTELHYNIQIHLPESRDPAVYDAVFQALRKHIL